MPRRSRCDAGLTTLEWLLIVAAVAGLAALAVVLVQNVVDETAEEISGSNARITAAEVAAARITSDARAGLPINQANNTSDDDDHWKSHEAKQKLVNEEYRSKCNRLEITYSDAGVKSEWTDAETASTPGGSGKSGTRRGHDSTDKAWTDTGAIVDEASCKIPSA